MAEPAFQFKEQVDFFRQKVNLPTAGWTDIQHEEHDRSFVVAGAMRDDLLNDFRSAVDKAIAKGGTLEEFRKDFDTIVAKHGWTYNGGRNWRSQVIYETNLRTSYAAGRWKQIQDVKDRRPYVRYRHNDAVLHPRPQHKAWDGLVLPVDSDWIATHWPPNGWGCRCFIESLAERDLKKLGKDGPDTPPPQDFADVVVGTRGSSPRTFRTPAGVDPGFGYTPGRSWASQQAKQALDEETAERSSGAVWRPEVTGGWQSLDRPRVVPLDATDTAPRPPATDLASAVDMVREAIGADVKTFDVHGLPVVIDAEWVGRHFEDDLARTSYLPFLVEALTDPFEVWVSQEVNDATGEVRIQARIIKAFDIGKGRALVVAARAQEGFFKGWTVFPTSKLNYLQKQRLGVLLYGR